MGASFVRCGYGVKKTFFKKKGEPKIEKIPSGTVDNPTNKLV
jgi:hypothetical protein